MTDKQLDQARAELRAKGYGWINGNYNKPPKEYKLREEELSCISMINSILAYGGFGYPAEEVMQRQERGYYNYLADYVKIFGRDKVVALIQGQIDDIVCVNRNVGRDGEGISYNSIVWKDN